MTGRAAEWAAGLVPIEAVPSLEGAFRQVRAARMVALEIPWSEALLRVFETTSYRALPSHDDHHVAATLGIEVEDVSNAILALTDAEVIERDERGLYRVKGALVKSAASSPRVRPRNAPRS